MYNPLIKSSIIYEVNKTNLIITGNNDEIHQEIIDKIIKNYDIENEKELIIKGEDNFIFHLTNSKNELNLLNGKNNNTNKVSIIDLGQCENLLKKQNGINENTSLIIMKFEKITNKSTERSIQYEVYEPYNKTKLNLSICENITIGIYIPVIISEKLQNLYNELKDMGYDLFDINSPFYQDICSPYKSSDGTDVLLSDRINTYYNNEETTCQSNCKFSNYLMESQYLKCDCDIKNSDIKTQDSKKFNAKSIYQSFFDILKYSNYKVLKCGKLILSINSITSNIGSIFTIIYFVIYSVFFIIYIIKGISKLKIDFSKNIIEDMNRFNKYMKVLEEKFRINKIEVNKKQELKSGEFIKAKDKIDNPFIKPSSKFKKYILTKDIQIIKKPRRKKRIQKILFTNPPKKKTFQNNKYEPNSKIELNILNNKIDNNILVTDKGSSLRSFNNKEKINENINKYISDIIIINKDEKDQLDSYEINNLEYDVAIELDGRNFFEIYWSLLKREHLIIFTFITKDDHNIVFVKYSRFIFLLCTDMAMNVFFFADETMHKMFLDYGKYNFIQQIPQIIYSTAISQLIEIFLCYLSLTDKHYYQVKESKKISKRSLTGIMKCIQIKIAFFYVFTSLMFIFYWYLICCFCAVYQNTQVAFIKDSLLSFALGIVIPFGVYLIPSLLRIISLKMKKNNMECLYNLSGMIPFF